MQEKVELNVEGRKSLSSAQVVSAFGVGGGGVVEEHRSMVCVKSVKLPQVFLFHSSPFGASSSRRKARRDANVFGGSASEG